VTRFYGFRRCFYFLLIFIIISLFLSCSSKKEIMHEIKPVNRPIIKKRAAVLRIYDNTDFTAKADALSMMYAGEKIPHGQNILELDSDTAELVSSYRINRANYYLMKDEELDEKGMHELENLRLLADKQKEALILLGIDDPDSLAGITFDPALSNVSKSYDSALSSTATAIITTNLDKSSMFVLVERERIDDILKEQKLAEDGLVQQNQVRPAGKLMGAEILFMGNISNFTLERRHVEGVVPTGALLYLTIWAVSGKEPKGARDMIWYTDHLDIKNFRLKCAVDLRAVDAVTGEVLYVHQGVADESVATVYISDIGGGVEYSQQLAFKVLEKAVTNAVYYMLEEIVQKPFRGRVAELADGYIYINAGRLQNVMPGDRFEVFGVRSLIEDPESGRLLGFEENTGCFIDVTDVDEMYSRALPVSECAVEQGDYVEFAGTR